MKRLLFVFLIAVAGVVSISALPRPTTAGSALPAVWPPLSETCYDVSGDGLVDLPNDILGVILRFNAKWGDDDYALLYDVTGGGVIDLPNDILGTILAFNPSPPANCSFIDTQVVQATVAVMKYQDPQVAFDDGYTWGSEDVVQMGIHLVNSAYQQQYTTFYDPITGEDQLHHPVGLVYSETFPGSSVPDVFIGSWYLAPLPATCVFYQIDPCPESATEQPVGFGTTNTDEDNQDPAGPQAAWHTHDGLCVAGWGTVDAQVWELGLGTEQACYDPPYNGNVWFSTYGWMMHLYNFVPNPDGRFMLWNTNPDFP